MVATRSQDHTLDDLEVQDIIENGPPSIETTNKRKAGGERGKTPVHRGDKKRRRVSNDEAGTESRSKVEENPRTEWPLEPVHGISNSEEVDDAANKESISQTSLQQASRRSSNGQPGLQVMQSVVVDPRRSRTSEVATGRTKRQKKGSGPERHFTEKDPFLLKISKAESTSAPFIAHEFTKSTHRKFSTMEIGDPELQLECPPIDIVQHGDASPSEDSEDEAPETVTVAAEKNKTQSLAIEAERIAAKREAAEKVKRRELDLRLKLQAKSSRKPSKVHQTGASTNQQATASDEVEDDGQVNSATPTNFTSDRLPKSPTMLARPAQAALPDLLPDDILAAEPSTRRLLTPPPSNLKASAKQKRKLLDVDSKPPKDVKHGKVKVRILQDSNSSLPPKLSTNGRAVREAWLMGRRGLQGQDSVPRKRLGSGFLRRSLG